MPTVVVLAMLSGFGAAVAQAWSYLISRSFVLHRRGGSLRLLALAHAWLGLVALVALPWTWQPPAADWPVVAGALTLSLVSYLSAQFWFFFTVARAPASRVAPLMGVKVVVLALLAAGLGLEKIQPLQWLALAGALVAVRLVSVSGQRLSWSAWAGLAATVCSFACSDIGIRMLLEALDPEMGFGACLQAAALNYACALVVTPCLLPLHGRPRAAELGHAGRYALAWGLGMIALFGAIGQAGVVLAIMMQALRGPLSVLFGAWLSWRDPEHPAAEQRFTRAAVIRQSAAALVMAGAAGAYAWLG